MMDTAEIDISLIDAFLAELSSEPVTPDTKRRIDQILDRRNEINQRDKSISLRSMPLETGFCQG